MLGAVREVGAGGSVERLSRDWRDFAENECGTYAPLYAAICRSVAEDPELVAVTAEAPESGQQPNVLLAAVHYLILSGLAHPLAEVYAGRADPTRAPALFRDLCLARRADIAHLLASRHTQTNEPGRATVLAVGLAVAAEKIGGTIGLLDAGCSAGLNLLIDQYRFEYGPAGGLGPLDSPVTISCELSGTAPRRGFRASPRAWVWIVHRSTSPTPGTPDGCSPASGPTPGACPERPPPSSWPGNIRPGRCPVTWSPTWTRRWTLSRRACRSS